MSQTSFFNYIPGSSTIHKLDPRTKYHFTLILVVLMVFYDNPLYFLISMIFTLILWRISEISIKDYLPMVKILLISISFMLIFNGFFIPGKKILLEYNIQYLGTIKYTMSGLLSSISLGLRFLTLFFMVPIVISTTSPIDIIASLRYLKIPYKLSFIFTIAIRFFPILHNSMIEVQQAQRSRGLETEKGNLIKKIYNFIPIIFPMVFKCIYIVDQLSWSIESRGYGLTKNPTIITQLKLEKIDYAIIITCWIIILLIPLFQFFIIKTINLPFFLRPSLDLLHGAI